MLRLKAFLIWLPVRVREIRLIYVNFHERLYNFQSTQPVTTKLLIIKLFPRLRTRRKHLLVQSTERNPKRILTAVLGCRIQVCTPKASHSDLQFLPYRFLRVVSSGVVPRRSARVALVKGLSRQLWTCTCTM